jgi:hypothetical protein
MASTELISPRPPVFHPALFTPTPKAAKRVLEFFTAQINNDHPQGVLECSPPLCGVVRRPAASANLPTYIPSTLPPSSSTCRGSFLRPTVKQHLAALGMLFDWLVTGHVLDVNPAHAVRGPKYVVKKGKTPVLTADEARDLLDSIEVIRTTEGADATEGRAGRGARPGGLARIARSSASWSTSFPYQCGDPK